MPPPTEDSDRKDADAALCRFEANFRLIEQGVIESPPEGGDLGTYIVSGGKLGGRPSQADWVEPKTLGDLFDSYLAHYPKGAKEGDTQDRTGSRRREPVRS